MNSLLPPAAFVQFIRTPRLRWPFNSVASAFWPPLGFCSLAAALRQRFPTLRLAILDCPPLAIGWRTLEARLRADPPAVLCLGEETVSSGEARRLARLARGLAPGVVIIAGGVYFSYAVEETFAEGDVDFIVRGEGEETLGELMQALLTGQPALAEIPGLAWREGGATHVNPLRAPIMDLDTLPWPAYDLLTVAAYGRDSRSHPRLASLEHSRGCPGHCSFCILWKHFGQPVNGSVAPCYRTKSAARSFAEVEWLIRDYQRETIHFVDPTFNADPQWSEEFADLLLESGRRVQFTAWMRADGVVRDEGLGVLEKLVRAGLVQAYIGIERTDEAELARLGKVHNGPEVTRRAFEILRQRYPQVFTIGTVIYGLPWESAATLRALRDFQYEYPIDYVLYIPVAPNPGTELRAELVASGRALSANLAEYNFLTPVMASDHLTRRQLENFYSGLLVHVTPAKLRSIVQAWWRRPPRVRRVLRRLCWYAAKVAWRQVGARWRKNGQPTLYAERPAWYDS